jgi:hypothetical protein
MKWFKPIHDAQNDDPWSLASTGLLFCGEPRTTADFMECLDELAAYSKCCNSGRCCQRAPELTAEEKKLLAIDYPDVVFDTGKPCPFRQNNRCAVHGKTEGFVKPLQCRSYICRPLVRNNQLWLRRFCEQFGLEFHDVQGK